MGPVSPASCRAQHTRTRTCTQRAVDKFGGEGHRLASPDSMFHERAVIIKEWGTTTWVVVQRETTGVGVFVCMYAVEKLEGT